MATKEHFIGAAAESFVTMKMLQKGYEVFNPVMGQTKIDLVVMRKGKLLKIQVKKATEQSSKGYKFKQVRLQGVMSGHYQREYLEDEFDYLAITDMKDVWMIPWPKVSHLKSFSFGSNAKTSRRDWNINDYKLKF